MTTPSTAALHHQIAELRKVLGNLVSAIDIQNCPQPATFDQAAHEYLRGLYANALTNAKAALSSSPASDLVAGVLAHLFAQYIIEQHENLEDRAPVDVFCGECNLDTGPHRATCVPHQAKALLAKP